MHSLIYKLFKKRGIEKLEDLTEEERITFKEWDKTLGKEELTLEDVKRFCNTQCEIIEGKWKDYTLLKEEKAELIPYHTIYKTLLTAIDSPKQAREALERQLTELTK